METITRTPLFLFSFFRLRGENSLRERCCQTMCFNNGKKTVRTLSCRELINIKSNAGKEMQLIARMRPLFPY